MISSIRGDVLHVGIDHAVVEVSGFGLHVSATPKTLADLHRGTEARLHTSFVPRQDDAPLLFGFSELSERVIFTTLVSISGIGPKMALAVLAVHTPHEVHQAIAESDTDAFTRVPGIGKKTAQRILLELAGKLVIDPPTPTAAAPAEPEVAVQVREALVSLGWTEKDARTAVEKLLAAQPELLTADVSTVLRQALRSLGGAR
ncbi:Holliday junction branch migration protein RuvA [Nesterenkonia sp. E16_7]|uniref:Holliday junction branch migration protein RuvA n=1 Tax=unclassified Nesterenkonia TaxID=2629769 RepID=UPI001A90E144|nr:MULTISPECIES: Holliday junction branch migration protein RuvA [unclassified Nesterenkonia]MBO0595985.1 Holliday junction branch migration protein RuvA [Nesterenkonia sp. E16_10]MBO0599415.1 Holliday junction branch migration protein RuvA [Nesterenkonia sp. E16_7]